MKKAFSLIELIVSVVLLGLIVVFVSSAFMQTKKHTKIFEKIVKKDNTIKKINDILYKDIFQSYTIEVKNYKNYSILELKTKHSIYNIQEPHVIWLVLKENNALLRYESAKKIEIPTKEENKKLLFTDLVSKECNIFSVNLSKDKQSVLIYLEITNQMPTVFEIEKL